MGDQLTLNNPALNTLDPTSDLIWMAEVAEESTKVWSHKARIALFLSAMRHFRQTLEDKGYPVFYTALEDPKNQGSFSRQLAQDCMEFRPQEVTLVQPGEWNVREAILQVCNHQRIPCTFLEDTHFLCSQTEFQAYAQGKKQLRMEFFYRWMRQKYNILMDNGKPEGDRWNYDSDNREPFSKTTLNHIPDPIPFPPDAITQEVLTLVERVFLDHPGNLATFDWPVTAEQALIALHDFIHHRLSDFGRYQDAMWLQNDQQKPYLYHSRLSAAMNLKLLDPLSVIHQVEAAYRQGRASLESVEGFIRQILGWREYVRGVYWLKMPDYIKLNHLKADQPLPAFYWNANTEMVCMKAAISQTLEYGYAHHIQRLMVTGLFALLLGVNPEALHQWYLAVYVDALEWVELPNTLGMSQFGDGGIMASKPYVATGKYIQRMSNYCQTCPYNPAEKLGPTGCPFTTLYWDFLTRHREELSRNPRMGFQVKNLSRLKEEELIAIQNQATEIRKKLHATHHSEAPS
ncbi:cryptochrome/photolyase family protein [Vampirovibrio sp.]|uniref:cryptochrome/photolyase family protein n=1 Tax=Vampirovibrio sp. TaxID=2717857 RepID=UPI003593A495